MNEGNAKAVLDEADAGDRLRFVRTDVSSESDVEELVADAVTNFGAVDVMFNNAGLGGAFGPVTEIRVEDWDWTFGVLCRGVFLGTKHAGRAMKEAGRGGSIINTASVAGLSGGAGPIAYSSAKAAVINFTRAASAELAAWMIRINAICPGAIATPLLAMGRSTDELQASLGNAQPWPGFGRADDIAHTALFLASDEARFVTGAAIVVDGGMTANGPNFIGRASSPLAGLVGVSRGNIGEEPFTIHPT
jgi:NAD(P)-dependent dehydrogenase (short-subunit alcohol dehydrogenase family)